MGMGVGVGGVDKEGVRDVTGNNIVTPGGIGDVDLGVTARSSLLSVRIIRSCL